MKLLKCLSRPLGFREGIIVVAVVTLAGSVAYVAPASGQASGGVAPTYGITLPRTATGR